VRAGYPDPTSVLWQGRAPWGSMTVGRGKALFGAVGCVVTSVAQARRILGERAGATPLDVQAAGLARNGVWGPGASGAVVSELVRAQGLDVGVDLDGPGRVAAPDVLRSAVIDCLLHGGVCLGAVDHDSALPSGDSVADHWTCIYAVDDDNLWMTDPATARRERISFEALSGPVSWGRRRRDYRLVRVVTVFR
jgi:hypothetical protein